MILILSKVGENENHYHSQEGAENENHYHSLGESENENHYQNSTNVPKSAARG